MKKHDKHTVAIPINTGFLAKKQGNRDFSVTKIFLKKFALFLDIKMKKMSYEYHKRNCPSATFLAKGIAR